MTGSGSTRDVDAILGELGRRLQEGYAAAPARRLRRPPRRLLPSRRRRAWPVAAVALALFAGPTAVATHDTLFQTAPPPAPGSLDGPGAIRPDSAGTPVRVAAGRSAGVPWTLAASLCRYGEVQAVGLFLDVPGGGAGARCDVAGPGRGARSPAGLRARRVQTYVDPVADRTWVFAALPSAVASADVRSRPLGASASAAPSTQRVPASGIDPRAVPRGVPAGLRVFAVALPGLRVLAGVDGLDATGAHSLTCTADGRCRPDRQESRP